MIKPSATIEGVVEDRRRPGRTEYTDPHLIELLRRPTAFGGALRSPGDGAAKGDDLAIAPTEAALCDTISGIDGASQAGDPDQESPVYRDGPIVSNQVCYVAGELVATTKGIVPIESVTAGDDILTYFGEKRVTWIRRFELSPAAMPHPELSAPVCLQCDAIAPGLPGRPLLVSPSHRLWVKGRLVPAWHLIDGLGAVQDLGRVLVTYIQVLFGPRPQRVAPVWHTGADRPQCLVNVPMSPSRISDRLVRLLINGKSTDPVTVEDQRCVFSVPSGCRTLQLTSPDNAAVVQIEIITQDSHEVIPADHPDLTRGWGPCQRDDQVMWRSVSGVADLPASLIPGSAMVVVYLRRNPDA